MKSARFLTVLVLILGLMVYQASVSEAAPFGTGFTYQGRLIDANNAADGLYDFQFKLYDANVAGTQKGSTIDFNEVDVIDGYFTVELDFGSVFDGNDRWLQISIRPGNLNDPNIYTILSPRQEVTPTPYALYAKTAGSGGSADSDWIISGTNMYSGVSGNVGIGTAIPGEKLTVEGGTIKASTPLSSGKGVYGYASNSGDYTNFGGYFEAAGGSGRGVFSKATGSTGIGVLGMASNSGDYTNYGGYFSSAGNTGRAVYGEAAGSSGQGVRGEATGNNGIGVSGYATNAGNYYNYGGYFEAAGSYGQGIHSEAAGSNGIGVSGYATYTGNYQNYGGYFSSAGSYGQGVYGTASNSGNYTNYGGYFSAAGSTGRAVYGTASNSGNYTNYGGYFSAAGVYGRAVYGEAVGSSGQGVRGESTNTGNYTNYGGYFQAAGSYGIGVSGYATNTGNQNYGGYFLSAGSSGRGVFSASTNTGEYTNYGGYFTAAGSYGRAVYGASSNSGNYQNYGGYFSAAGSTGTGVYGVASNNGEYYNYGGYFKAAGFYGRGVYGEATGSAGRGVYGLATGAAGYGVCGYSSTGYDFYAAGPGTNYGPFTGGHEVKLSDDFPANIRIGMIVSVTGETQVRRDNDGKISISSTLPTVKLCDVANDKAVFGVFVVEGPLPKDHWYRAKESERFATVNALGEGRVWVCDINGKVEVGDYITTSPVPGYGQKQYDNLLRSCTLGKATENVDWDSVTETIEFGGRTYKVYLIAVVYTSG